MGRAFRSQQRGLGQYSRRRRMLLVSCTQAAEPSLADLQLDEQILLDPEVLKIVRASADYLNQKSCGVDSLIGAASNLIRGQTTGSAVLADFPEVECEIVPLGRKSVVRPAVPVDPESVLSDFDAPAQEPDLDETRPLPKFAAAPAPEETLGRELTIPELPPAAPLKPSVRAKRPRALASAESLDQTAPLSMTGLNRLRGWLHNPQPRVWMFIGDETTACMRYQGKPGYAEMFRHRLRWELRRFSDSIVNAGIVGAGVNELIKVSTQGLEQCRADAVFVMPGKSDLEMAASQPDQFARKYIELTELIRSFGAEPLLQTPPLIRQPDPSEPYADVHQMADLIREVALMQQVGLIDHTEYWMEQPQRSAWSEPHGENLTEAGQSVLAMLFFSELDLFDQSSPLCTRLLQAWQTGPEILAEGLSSRSVVVPDRSGSDIIT